MPTLERTIHSSLWARSPSQNLNFSCQRKRDHRSLGISSINVLEMYISYRTRSLKWRSTVTEDGGAVEERTASLGESRV
jgi:hypothetical protein